MADARLLDTFEWSGYRSAHFARTTGTLIVVVDGFAAGLEDPADPVAPRWFTICDDHGTCCGHDTLALARSHSSCPEGWCGDCAAEQAVPPGRPVVVVTPEKWTPVNETFTSG